MDNVEFKPTRDLRVLVDRIWSFTPTKPREIEAAHEAMQRMSWIYPVRDGVSALDGDRSAGLRYLLNNNPSGPPQQDGHVCPLFASYRNRPAGYDNMDVGILYRFPNEGEGCGANGPHQCANVGVNHSTIVWRESLAHVFAHETGHCFGLVNPNAPHFDPSGQASHSRLETIDVEESDLGFNLQFNRPFPSPTLDLMFPTGPCPGEPAEQSSLHPYDWEFLRQKLMQLPSTGPAGPSVSWQGLGGVTPAPHLAVGKNADGRQEVFMLGMDRALYHQWELTPGGAWSGWVSLGGTQLQGPIAVANHADGRLEVYVRGGDGYLYFRNQIVPNGNWNGWSGLGGGPVKDFTVARNSDGRLELVAVWTDGTLRDVWQVAPNGGWSGWASLGGTALAGPVAFGQNADGRLEAFAVGGDGIVYHQWQTIPSSGPWSGWRSLAHASLPAVADLAINRTGDGRLFLLLMRADRSLSYRMQTTPNGGWGDAVNLWGHSLQWPAAVAQRPDGRLEVLVIGGDRQLYSRWQVDSARPDVWADWLPLGGTAIQPGVTIGYTASGDVDAYVIGGDGALYRGPRR